MRIKLGARPFLQARRAREVPRALCKMYSAKPRNGRKSEREERAPVLFLMLAENDVTQNNVERVALFLSSAPRRFSCSSTNLRVCIIIIIITLRTRGCLCEMYVCVSDIEVPAKFENIYQAGAAIWEGQSAWFAYIWNW